MKRQQAARDPEEDKHAKQLITCKISPSSVYLQTGADFLVCVCVWGGQCGVSQPHWVIQYSLL